MSHEKLLPYKNGGKYLALDKNCQRQNFNTGIYYCEPRDELDVNFTSSSGKNQYLNLAVFADNLSGMMKKRIFLIYTFFIIQNCCH